jgi:hypothetical protein
MHPPTHHPTPFVNTGSRSTEGYIIMSPLDVVSIPIGDKLNNVCVDIHIDVPFDLRHRHPYNDLLDVHISPLHPSKVAFPLLPRPWHPRDLDPLGVAISSDELAYIIMTPFSSIGRSIGPSQVVIRLLDHFRNAVWLLGTAPRGSVGSAVMRNGNK